MNDALPSGWTESSFGTLTVNHDGRRVPLKATDRAARRGAYRYFGAQGVIDHIDDYLFDGTYLLVAEDGANLVSRVQPIAQIATGRFWVNNHAHVVEGVNGVSLRFLRHFMNGNSLDGAIRGTAQPKLTQADLNRLRVPLPPTAEQNRIVAAIEEQFSRLDAAVAALEQARQNLEHMRSAILQRAVTAPVGTPSVFARDLFSWASGKRTLSAKNRDGQFPVFGGNGITGHSEKVLKAEETIVIGRVGALCGNVFLTGGPAWITDNAIYAQSYAENILLPYAVLVFRSARLRDRAAGTGQPFVNQVILNEVTIPLRSKEQQAEIVARHDATEEAITDMEHHLQTLNQRQIRLRSSILAAAFSGDLVAQDPQDEPASVLLERLAAERAASNGHKQTRTRKPRAREREVTA